MNAHVHVRMRIRVCVRVCVCAYVYVRVRVRVYAHSQVRSQLGATAVRRDYAGLQLGAAALPAVVPHASRELLAADRQRDYEKHAVTEVP